MRVLLLALDYPPALGGIQRLLHRITQAMPQAETRVIALDHPKAPEFDRAHKQRIHRVKIGVAQPWLRNILFNVHTIAGRFPWSDWSPDVILNGHVITGPAAVALARRFGASNVLYTYGKEVIGRRGLAAWTLAHSDAGIAVSEFTRSLMQEAFGAKALPRPVSVIHPGVEIPADPDTKANIRPTILTISRLRDWYKGHDKILEAMPAVVSKVPDAQWIVIGDGPIRPLLEERAQGMDLGDAVQFLGAVSDKERDKWLGSANVFAMPSRYPDGEVAGEGFPVVYLEAAAWALPAVAGDVGGPREAVLNEQTGLLVDPESSIEIATALTRLLSDPVYAEKLGRQARTRAANGFRWEEVGSQLENALRATVKASTV